MPVYLNALAGRGVHVVTVNDYLAKRDAEWMGQIYKFLGLTVGVIVHGLDDEQRKKEYDCDVTYATNNELGFDYLRDNMKYRLEDMVQRGHIYAIVDEVDSILIDEARTPLIISGPLDDRSDFYNTIDTYIPKLEKSDYELDEKQRTVELTEAGMEKMEQRLRGPICSRATRSTTSRTSRPCTMSTRRCAPTSCSSATRTTSSGTAKSSSSTNSPAA